MIVDIDEKSGFCFGVVTAIKKAEEVLLSEGNIYSLGDIMHNKVEMNRLKNLGLQTISLPELDKYRNKTVLIRAHGEPPATYTRASELNIRLIDATCKVVAALQRRVKQAYDMMSQVDGQVVILGKKGHPEVVGLSGQVENNVIVIENIDDLLKNVDFKRPIYMLSQTTKSLHDFDLIKKTIEEKAEEVGNNQVIIKDTICRQVSNRYPHLQEFAGKYDVVLFVSGNESSNGKALYENCLLTNPNTYKIEDSSQIDWSKLEGATRVGICGATSTPRWLMEQIKQQIIERESSKNISDGQ